MMLCAVNQIALLASLGFICVLLITGICTLSVLIAKQNSRRNKIMQTEDYIRKSDITSVDCDETHVKTRGKGKYKKRRERLVGDADKETGNETEN